MYPCTAEVPSSAQYCALTPVREWTSPSFFSAPRSRRVCRTALEPDRVARLRQRGRDSDERTHPEPRRLYTTRRIDSLIGVDRGPPTTKTPRASSPKRVTPMTYDYVCTACGHAWEAEQRISEAPLTDCPACASATAKRQISGGQGFILKGGGWYSDLYSSSGGKGSGAGKTAPPPSESTPSAAPSSTPSSAPEGCASAACGTSACPAAH